MMNNAALAEMTEAKRQVESSPFSSKMAVITGPAKAWEVDTTHVDITHGRMSVRLWKKL
ncbi:MAG: hypothetical protein ACOX4I_08705 [Anaerovoracaceae bacterium]